MPRPSRARRRVLALAMLATARGLDANATAPQCAAAVVRRPFARKRAVDAVAWPRHRYLVPNPECPERRKEVRRIRAAAGARLTLGFLYYTDAAHLRHKVARWNAFSKPVRDAVHVVVIDDGSPEEHRAAPIVRAGLLAGPRATVVEVDRDLPWNVAGARNLLFATAPTDVVLMSDLDYDVPEALAAWALERAGPLADECKVLNGFARPDAVKPHPGAMMLSRRTYWHVAGCDEDLVGHHGGTDPTFRWKVAASAPHCLLDRRYDAPPLLREDGRRGARSSHDPAHNHAVVRAKKDGARAWATTVLRFSWRVAYDSAFDGR